MRGRIPVQSREIMSTVTHSHGHVELPSTPTSYLGTAYCMPRAPGFSSTSSWSSSAITTHIQFYIWICLDGHRQDLMGSSRVLMNEPNSLACGFIELANKTPLFFCPSAVLETSVYRPSSHSCTIVLAQDSHILDNTALARWGTVP